MDAQFLPLDRDGSMLLLGDDPLAQAGLAARHLLGVDLEFLLADLAMTERRLERLKASGRHGTPAEREAAEREEIVVRRLHEGLQAGSPIRDLGLDADEEKQIRGFRFLTQKPVLVLLNVGETPVPSRNRLVTTIGYRLNGRTPATVFKGTVAA